MTCEKGTLNLKNVQTGSSSCQSSTTSIGQRNETIEFAFRTQKKSRNTRKNLAGTLDVSGPGDEKKWYGTLPCTLEGKWDSTATRMVERFKDTGHPVFKSISALSRGILKRKNTLQCGCFEHRALVPNFHSVNQLSIYGAVPDW